ncbi:MAG TPA: hypothetical protein VFC92_09905 [Bacteroidales bacterium]|nr:hypothetical protein [Bacteroidales bacterium]
MKKFMLAAAVLLFMSFLADAQEYKVVTTVESVVPMGLGRSRIIESGDTLAVADFTTERTDGKKSKQNQVSRADAKIDNFQETKLLNFYSAVGINFQNIASNDAMITAKINQLVGDGWKLQFITSGVESDAGKDDHVGIFITRYIFYRE